MSVVSTVKGVIINDVRSCNESAISLMRVISNQISVIASINQ